MVSRASLVKLALGGSLVCIALGLFVVASHVTYDSDMVQNYLELHTVFSGEPLLPHWVLVSDNYYLTDLPFYVLLSAFVGTNWTLLFVVPWVVYVLLLVIAADLAAYPGWPLRSAAVAYIATLFCLGMLFSGDSILLVSAYHNATILLALAALWLARPALTARASIDQWRIVSVACLVFAISGSDPFGDVFFIAPFVLVLAARYILRHGNQAATLRLLTAVIIAALIGAGFPLVMRMIGGFASVPAFSIAFAPAADWARNAGAILGGFLDLFSARSPLVPAGAIAPVAAALRFAAALFALGSVAAVLVRARQRPDEGVLQVLAIGCAMVLSADLLSTQFAGLVGKNALGQSLRYVVPIYTFSSILAAHELPRLIARKAPKAAHSVLVLGLIGALLIVGVSFGQEIGQKLHEPRTAPIQWQARLARWLAHHDLRYGVGDYWTANVVSALSDGSVTMNAIEVTRGHLRDYRWVSDLSSRGHPSAPEFAAFTSPNRYGVTVAAIERVYGHPSAVYRRRHCVVLVLGGRPRGPARAGTGTKTRPASRIASR